MPPRITIVGLGPGDPALLTQRAWERLQAAPRVLFRTGLHPVAAALPAGVQVETFDALYDQAESFEVVYQTIVERLLQAARRPGGVLYAVPGDPMVGEATVAALREAASGSDLTLEIIPGVSFIEPCLELVGWDALDGLSLVDALEVAARHHPPFPPDTPALLGQLYGRMVAAEVKLTLMNQYPGDHPVTLIQAAGTPQARRETLALLELDRRETFDHTTSLYIPALPVQSAFESFQDTVARLRAPGGCPWDREQTHRSLRPHLLGEAYEALEAIDADDMHALREELGDLLLQIVIQAQIATEEGDFSMAQVVEGINSKIRRRHPHVFGEVQVDGVEQVMHNWEALKAQERLEADRGEKGVLDGVPQVLPALAQADELQSRAARLGFDWPDVQGVIDKVREELEEVRQAGDPQERAAEMGDLLFAVVNYARWLQVDPEAALREANGRFRRRFAHLEREARRSGRDLSSMTLEELDSLWEAAKRAGE